ncbi:ABC transporter ATP-binding protein [Chromobacterium sp. IIBBL 290-4]|uniref:ABC transporter ATP-binding protein n=1 Tax=Chromobacterium sp. IIBBL 290-4 TaxID=2953890 RepID=UPI0020B8AB1B|nr:ABC transporter ATP-binding protein [Chromobacterium sp. IIBBL 290-4]UTH74189.1 ABC transporter ATP-binding protein [Chromobacterium sp. IIBBL 290-4]
MNQAIQTDRAEWALRMREVNKSFGRPVIQGMNLNVRRGEFYTLLGANGAGKTTTLRMAVGLTQADSGEIQLLGRDLKTEAREIKQRLAFLPDEPLLYDKLKPLEYLEYVAGLWGMQPARAQEKAVELINWLGLSAVVDEVADGFSRGMRQKLALAGALIHEPELIILDEPLTGLDAAAAKQVKDLLQSHVETGGTVIFSTHIMEVAERLAQRIGIIRDGRLLAEGTLDALRSQLGWAQGSLEDVFLEMTGQAA